MRTTGEVNIAGVYDDAFDLFQQNIQRVAGDFIL
jgi:hypothetical protein